MGRPAFCRRARASVVPVLPLLALVPFLRFDAQRGDGTGFEPFQPDRLGRLLAEAVGAVLDPLQPLVDLRDQLARPVAGPEFQRAVGFEGRPIGYIGFVEAFLLKMAERFGRFPPQLIAPATDLLSEILINTEQRR